MRLFIPILLNTTFNDVWGNIGIRGMTYTYIFIIGVSIRDYVSDFQVAVVLILRASSDFPLIYFQMPRNYAAVSSGSWTICSKMSDKM
jgi:hypothetical protein